MQFHQILKQAQNKVDEAGLFLVSSIVHRALHKSAQALHVWELGHVDTFSVELLAFEIASLRRELCLI